MSMSFSNEKINLNNLNELEEGEISDSNLNKQDILKLIDKQNNLSGKRSPKRLTENRIFLSSQSETSRPNISDDEDEEVEVMTIRNLKKKQESEDEEETGFFHKMFKKENEGEKISRKSEGFLKVKRKSSKEIEQEKDKKKQFKKIEKKPQEVEYQIKPVYEPKSKKDKNKQDFKPRLICQYWVNGACNKGKECTFSHEAPQVKKQEMCKYFLTGSCMKREDCLFSHDITALPCKFFHAIGCCMNGESCKFSHGRLNEHEIFKFIEQNEEFMLHLYKTMGRTNMDDFLQKYLQDKGKLQGDLKSCYGANGNLGNTGNSAIMANSSHNNGSLPPSGVMLPHSMQHVPQQEQGQKIQGSFAVNIPNIHSKLITQQNTTISNMNLNLMNPISPLNQPSLTQSQIPQQMYVPRMDNSNLNLRPPLSMLNQPKINSILQNNPTLLINFMRNPNAFQGMIQLQSQKLANMPGAFPINTNNIQNEEIIFNSFNNVNQKVQRSLEVKNVISQVNPFQKPQVNLKNENSPQNMQSKVLLNNPLQQISQNQIINNTREAINLNESESEKEEIGFFLKSLKNFQPESNQINSLKLPSHFETGNPSNMIESQSNLNEASYNNIDVSINEPSEKLSRDPRKKFKRKLK